MDTILMLPAPAQILALPAHNPMAAFRAACQKLADALLSLVRALAEALAPVVKYVLSLSRKIWEFTLRFLIPPKWRYLHKHARRRRVRKKYEKRIREVALKWVRNASG